MANKTALRYRRERDAANEQVAALKERLAEASLMLEAQGDHQQREVAALVKEKDLGDAVLDDIRDTLVGLGCLHFAPGDDSKAASDHLSPMMYPEWIMCVIARKIQDEAARHGTAGDEQGRQRHGGQKSHGDQAPP